MMTEKSSLAKLRKEIPRLLPHSLRSPFLNKVEIFASIISEGTLSDGCVTFVFCLFVILFYFDFFIYLYIYVYT